MDEIGSVLFVYGSPVGFRNTIYDQNNYQLIRNQTYIHARLKDSFIDESSILVCFMNEKPSYIGSHFWKEFSSKMLTSLSF